MKTLLLTDIPPCHNYTAGLVTAQVCRALQPGELAAFVILNKDLNPEPEPDLNWIPTAFFTKPEEQGRPELIRRDAGEFGVFVNETRTRVSRTAQLIREAVRFGREQEVDQVWAILQGQTMVRVSRRVAKALRVPLKTQIWDPLSWWHRARNVDRVNRYFDNREMARLLRESAVVAAPSQAMARHITQAYGTKSIPLIASVNVADSHEPARGFLGEKELVIGMAGQFYAMEGWQALCDALDANDWTVEGRRVVLKTLGGSAPPNRIPPENVQYGGWLEQKDAIAFLSRECDVLYCPYPFSDEMEEVSRYSFPSKIVIYLAAGRPVLFHGPDYSSPFQYLRENEAGLLCSELGSAAIVETLRRIVLSPDLYRDLTTAGRAAFLRDFTLEKQRRVVHEFIEVEGRTEPAQVVDRFKPRARTGGALAKIRARLRGSIQEDEEVAARFDHWYYLRRYKDTSNYRGGFLRHYTERGWREDRNPAPWFSTWFYLSAYPDAAKAGVEPFHHYLTSGWREGRDPNPLFSTRFYLESNPEVAQAGIEPVSHYLSRGWREGRQPSEQFSTTAYIEANPALADKGIEPMTYHLEHGWREGRDPNHWFSTRFYLESNPDIAQTGIEPFGHYLTKGWRESRDPNSWFSTSYYLAQNPGLAEAGIEPFRHYLTEGMAEGQQPNDCMSTRFNLAERLITKIVQEIQFEIRTKPGLDRSVVASYFDLMHETNRTVHSWLETALDSPGSEGLR